MPGTAAPALRRLYPINAVESNPMPPDNVNTFMLKGIPLFASIAPEILRKLMTTMRQIELPPGTVFVNEGESGDSFYILLDGTVDIIKSHGTAEEQVLNSSGPGDFIGEMSLFEPGGRRTASVRTRTAIWALQMTRAEFDQLLHSQPQLAFEVSRVLSLRVRQSNNDLLKKNTQLEQALKELKAAQAELIEKERMEHELAVARQIQQDILPKEFPQPDHYTVSARMEPAREVGGDFFDVIPLSRHRTGIVIGDVSDKGVGAAIFMAMTRSLMRAEARRSSSPSQVLTRVNHLVGEMSHAAMFVTVLYGILDCESHVFEYARAGHEIPILVTSDGRTEQLGHAAGQPLGMFDEPTIDEQRIQMQPGQTLILYTDGATDITDAEQKFFGLDRLRTLAGEQAAVRPDLVCDRIFEAILAHRGEAPQFDDVTLVTIHATL